MNASAQGIWSRLYGMMQSLLAAAVRGYTFEVPAGRRIVEVGDAREAALHIAASVDQLAQEGTISAANAQWLAALLMLVRDYVEPLPIGRTPDGTEDLVASDLQHVVALLRSAKISPTSVESGQFATQPEEPNLSSDRVWLVCGGDEEHRRRVRGEADHLFDDLADALGLLAYVLAQIRYDVNHHPFPNDLGALACFTRTYRDLRAATLLAQSGYDAQARALLRGAYEAAGLGRMLARDPQLAEKWLVKQEWIPDRDVRAYIESQTLPEGSASPYREFYKAASAWAHPAAKSTIPSALDPDGAVYAKLATVHRYAVVQSVLREVLAMAMFACFALQRAMVNEVALPTWWRQKLAELANNMNGKEVPHLRRDWQKEQERFEAMRQHVLPADQLEEYLQNHPNSWRNVTRRMSENEVG